MAKSVARSVFRKCVIGLADAHRACSLLFLICSVVQYFFYIDLWCLLVSVRARECSSFLHLFCTCINSKIIGLSDWTQKAPANVLA